MSASDEREQLAARIRGMITDVDVREMRMFGGVGFMVREALAIVAERGGEKPTACKPEQCGCPKWSDLTAEQKEKAKEVEFFHSRNLLFWIESIIHL